ncbi:MAG TPA: aldolase [Dehalococcoidia bacterium]|nr:aldolase [Dehalococcoidia bacterium]
MSEATNAPSGSAPADVPTDMESVFEKNWSIATRDTGRLALFAGDQKVEHLNDDFAGVSSLGPIASEDGDPEHLFRIASGGVIGAFATQLGLVAKYGLDYADVPYIVKLNSKTHLLKGPEEDPRSLAWASVQDAVRLRERGLMIVGVGFTIYPGSRFESEQFAEASRACLEAHREGLLAVVWAYPRGRAVADERDAHLIAGAAGVGAALGADFCKVNYPADSEPEAFIESVRAAGRTGVISAGGATVDARSFLQGLHDQLNIAGARGSATGRNIHQKPLDEAIRMTRAIAAITYDSWNVDDALDVFHGRRSYPLK